MKKYKTAKFLNINGKYQAFDDEQDLIELLNREIERLNLGYSYLEKFFSKREDYEWAELVRQCKEANVEWLENAVDNN